MHGRMGRMRRVPGAHACCSACQHSSGPHANTPTRHAPPQLAAEQAEAEKSGGKGGSSSSGSGQPPPPDKLQAFTCGLLAGLVAKLTSHPLDVAKKRYQVGCGLSRM